MFRCTTSSSVLYNKIRIRYTMEVFLEGAVKYIPITPLKAAQ